MAFFGLLPLAALWAVFDAVTDGRVTPDFSLAYYPAAEALLAGDDIYPTVELVERGAFLVDYLYPPLTAIAVVPFTVLSVDVAEVLFASVLVLVFAATLATLGVRDWRCYGLAFLWPPVLDAIQTENVTIFLGLAAAVVWRFRDVPLGAGVSLGVSFAIKILLWPLAVWMTATRRVGAATWSLVAAAMVVTSSWAVIGFEGLRQYPGLLRRANELQEGYSYTVYALALDLGASPSVARVLWLFLAAFAVGWVVAAARRGDDKGAFVLAIAATLACSPIVWLHYFALLLVAVALAAPRLAPVWFLGLPMHLFVTTGVHNGSTFQTAAMLVAGAVTVALALRPRATDWHRGRPRAVAGSS